MSKRSRTADKAARAMRAKVRNDNAMIAHIEQIESKATANKKITPPESKQPADAPVREAPYDRLLRRLREENAAARKE